MDTQPPNPNSSHPDGYTKLNDDEPNSSANFSSNQRGSEETKSSFHHRNTTSGQEAPNSGSAPSDQPRNPNQSQQNPRLKELDSSSGTFYKVILVLAMIIAGLNLLLMLGGGFFGLMFDKLDFVAECWSFSQSYLAFSGRNKKDLAKIEKAVQMMKIYLPLFVVSALSRAFEVIRSHQRYGSRNSPGFGFLGGTVFHMGLNLILIFWPTIKARDILKSPLPEDDRETGNESEPVDPIEKLGSLPFVIYKYVVLIVACFIAKDSFSWILELEKMFEFSSFFSLLFKFGTNPMFLVSIALIFEGIRRKSLEKVLTSIKLMKIGVAIESVLYVLRGLAYYNEGKFAEEAYKLLTDFEKKGVSLSDLQNPADAASEILFDVLANLAIVYLMLIYGALKVRNVLKAHEKARYTL